jgi:hypothetical protein
MTGGNEMQKNSDNFSMQDALRLAKSDAGQQLFAMLRSKDSDTLNKAMEQAESGNYEQVKKTLSSLLDSPELRAMLEQLGGMRNE